MRSSWRTVADNLPLGTPGVTPRTGRRTVQRAALRGPETRAVPSGEAGIVGFQAQLGSPMGPAAPNWTPPPPASKTDGPSPAPSAPSTTDWWYR